MGEVKEILPWRLPGAFFI